MTNRPSTRENLARNLRYLLDSRDWTEKDLAIKSGVAQKTVNNALHQRTATSIDNADRMGRAFGLDGWQMIKPGLIREIEAGGAIDQVVSLYLESGSEGQEMILRIAEREAKYAAKK